MPGFTECPLCGACVPREELAKYGYCKVCLLYIKALTGK